MPLNLTTRRSLLIAPVALTVACPALAHGFHAAFAVIELNPRTGSLEIIHRIFVQDFELMLTDRAGAQVNLNDGAEMQKAVADYLRDAFTLATPEGKALSPDWIGMKLQADTMFVYQEVPKANDIAGLTVNDQILTATHPGQVNTVNITARGRTQTLIFTADDGPQTVQMEK